MQAMLKSARPGSSSTTSSSGPGSRRRAAAARTRYVAAPEDASRTITGMVTARPWNSQRRAVDASAVVTSLELLQRQLHPAQHRLRILLVVEVLVLVARRVHVLRELAVRRQEERARDVLAVRGVLLADVGVLVLVELDHHELLRRLDDLVVVEHAAEVLAVRTPLGEEDEADGLLV